MLTSDKSLQEDIEACGFNIKTSETFQKIFIILEGTVGATTYYGNEREQTK